MEASHSGEDSESIRAQIEAIDAEIVENEYHIQQINERQEHLNFQRELLVEKLDVKKAVKADKLSGNLEGTDFPWSKKLKQIMQDTFKINELRPQQLLTINATMSEHDCILIMPTGGGKSLCFQLPALLSKGITLVVSPLVSLMEDQLMALQNLSINAEILTATTPKVENKRILQAMINPESKLKILYVTPEKLSKSKMFLSKVQKMYGMGRFSRLAVDEVHCCSQWGHDFRKDYKFLGVMKRQFPKVPVVGFTATATTRVVKDIQKMLCIENCLVFRAPFNRPNLVYKVFPKPTAQKDVIDELVNIIQTSYRGQSGIVYCLSVKETEEVAAELQKQNIKALPYHANLEATYRSMVHASWVKNKIQVVVATIAFGMGIDKPDVRFVIHHTMSRTIENYYQESGRAGRDNKPADCVIFHRFGDIFRQSGMVISDSVGLTHLYAMVSFCTERKRCRRATLADHFGELWNEAYCNKMCDNCNPKFAYGGSKSLTETVDVSDYCRSILKILNKAKMLKQNLTALKLLDAWMSKSKSNVYSAEVVTPKHPRSECEKIITHLLLEGYIQEKFTFTAYSTISYIIAGVRSASLNKSSCKIEMQLIQLCGRNKPATAVNSTEQKTKDKKRKRPAVEDQDTTKFKACVVKKENFKITERDVSKKITREKDPEIVKSELIDEVVEPVLVLDVSSSSSGQDESPNKKHVPIIKVDDSESDNDKRDDHCTSALKREVATNKTSPSCKRKKSSP